MSARYEERMDDEYSISSHSHGMKRSNYRRVGGTSNIDESLFGPSTADKRKNLRKAGNSIIRSSPEPASVTSVSRSEISNILVRFRILLNPECDCMVE